MNDRQLQLALREWRSHMRQPPTGAALLGVSAILALAGPFETGEVLRLVPRFVYWGVIVVASYSLGHIISGVFSPVRGRWPLAVLIAVSGFCIGLAVSFVVMAVNYAALGFFPAPNRWLEFFGVIIAISMIVNAVSTIVAMNMASQSAPQTAQSSNTPPLFDRLPFDKRGPLIALSVEDHYVRVHTTKGEELILMRLSDAIKEVGNCVGAQVHRSHWAAFDQITKTRRESDRAILTMTNGIDIPVSRSNMAKVKEAGLLPR